MISSAEATSQLRCGLRKVHQTGDAENLCDVKSTEIQPLSQNLQRDKLTCSSTTTYVSTASWSPSTSPRSSSISNANIHRTYGIGLSALEDSLSDERDSPKASASKLQKEVSMYYGVRT